jgi:hypothetical protein
MLWYENLKKRDHWEEPDIDRIILKHMKGGAGWIHPNFRQRPVASNEPSGFVQSWKFEHLNNY